jgi:putative transposase
MSARFRQHFSPAGLRIRACVTVGMPRRRRCFVEGLSCHVTQRGVDRGLIFRSRTDYAVFLAILRYESERWRLRIHAYTLMRNHVHLLATPESATSLPKTMQALGRRYIPFFNRRYRRTGGLWEGRYKPALVYDERYWLICMRYVELNPVRAGIVDNPEQYRWSSYAHHAFGRSDTLVSGHPLYSALGATAESRQLAWRRICGQDISSDQLDSIRKSIREGIVLGDPVCPEVVSG